MQIWQRKIASRPLGHLRRGILVAVAGAAMCGPALACEQWSLDLGVPYPGLRIPQANGLAVMADFSQQGKELSGDAQFYSPTLKATVYGVLSGTLDGDQVSFKVEWSGQHQVTCPILSSLPACFEDYRGVGVYEGSVDANGHAEGLNWDFGHPNDKFGWYVVEPLKCADPPPPPKPDPVTAAIERPAGRVILPPPPDRTTSEIESAPRAIPGPLATPENPGGNPGGNPGMPSPPPSSAPPASLTTGTFDTDFGVLELGATEGTYSQNSGHVTVTKTNGKVVRGIWEQSTSARPCGDGRFWGKFVFVFEPGGFTGSYGYCKGALGAGQWNGKRRP